jgi:DNA-binding transcriptional MerR regulator
VSDSEASRSGKSDAAFRTISEVATELDVPQHVLRFWESKFSQVRPLKRGGGRRYYRPEDIVLLKRIRALLYDDGLTIKGVQKLFKDHGLKTVLEGEGGPVTPPDAAIEDPKGAESTSVDLAAVLSDLKNLRDTLRTALATN